MKFFKYLKEGIGKLNIAYKVMKYDPKSKMAISIVQDTTKKFKPKKGLIIKMPGKGIYLSLSKKLVIDMYALSDINILLKFQFNENDIIEGNLNIKDAIITVKEAKLIDYFIIDASGNKVE